MAPVYAPNVVELHMNFLYQDEPAQNTLYYLFASEPDGGDIDALCQAQYEYWATNGSLITPQSCILVSCEGLSLDGPEGPTGEYSPVAPTPGVLFDQAATNQDTLSVSFRTGFSGRGRRGRNYWIGLTEPMIANNRVAAGPLADIAGYYDGMITPGVLPGAAIWGVYSRRFNNADRLIGLFTPITEVVIVNDVVDTQRRRMP